MKIIARRGFEAIKPSSKLGLRENLPAGGRLFFSRLGKKIRASKRVLRWIRRGYPL